MRSSFIATLFVGALASPALNRAEQKILGEQQQQQQQQQQPSFCNEAKALIAQDSQVATAYCSAYLDLPVITVQKTISRVTKTFTKITSTKTYLDYPVTTKVAKTITHSSTVFGRATTTITTTTSTETYTNPLSTCPVARQNDCSSKLNNKNKNSLRSSRPACLSKYISPPQISQACSCLSLPLSSTTTTFHQHPTGQGETAVLLPLPTQTITLLTAAKLTRTLTRTLTTGTVTLTPTHDGYSSSTKTMYAAATETLILDGPFRLASGKDYDFLSSSRKRNGVEWVHVNSTAMRESRSKNDGKAIWRADEEEEECLSTTTTPTWFALNGQTLVTQNFGNENQFPRYELIGNVKIVPGEGVAGVYFSLPDSSSSSSRSNHDDDKGKNGEFGVEGVEGKRVPLSCSFGRKKSWNHSHEEEEEEEAEINLHEACPLTCRYVGGAGSRNSKREGGQWFVGYGGGDGKDGQEEEEYESFTMYAYRYGGLGS